MLIVPRLRNSALGEVSCHIRILSTLKTIQDNYVHWPGRKREHLNCPNCTSLTNPRHQPCEWRRIFQSPQKWNEEKPRNQLLNTYLQLTNPDMTAPAEGSHLSGSYPCCIVVWVHNPPKCEHSINVILYHLVLKQLFPAIHNQNRPGFRKTRTK
jgi:hypothetical protein